MSKTATLSWDLRPDLKQALEEAAQKEGATVADLLEQISTDWLGRVADPEGEQARLQATAARHFGTISGSNPERAANASQLVKRRLGSLRREDS